MATIAHPSSLIRNPSRGSGIPDPRSRIAVLRDSRPAGLRTFKSAIRDEESGIREEGFAISDEGSAMDNRSSLIAHPESFLADPESPILDHESLVLSDLRSATRDQRDSGLRFGMRIRDREEGFAISDEGLAMATIAHPSSLIRNPSSRVRNLDPDRESLVLSDSRPAGLRTFKTAILDEIRDSREGIRDQR